MKNVEKVNKKRKTLGKISKAPLRKGDRLERTLELNWKWGRGEPGRAVDRGVGEGRHREVPDQDLTFLSFFCR
jgi:hypothetical protein